MSEQSYYIKKEELQQALIDYKQASIEAEQNGLPVPRVPEYIGDCFVKIATKMAYRPNFIGYTFREEMVSDAIENCLMYFRNYNTEKYSNPFGYFSKIVWQAFLRRIAKEKRELAKKYKYIENMDITDIVTQEHDNGQFTNQFVEFLKTELDFVDIDKRIITTRKQVKESDTLEFEYDVDLFDTSVEEEKKENDESLHD
jgi:DNA-directed RNA polymerase specialized sigma24 family protein